ncbi:MAG: glutamyl-tRNA reductase [Anaerolineales bacterium]|nr:MAG: glutamyl-tRNA reductase [Anaerolineales bacterium]
MLHNGDARRLVARLDDVFVMGLNHKIAPVEVRERLALGGERTSEALRELAACMQPLARRLHGAQGERAWGEVVILSTCNRTEIYACAPAGAESAVRGFLSGYSRISSSTLNAALYTYHGLEAACHLLRVAAGLDSLVIGENEILGQVKDAFQIAHAAETTGPILSALFRYAVQTGKRVRNQTDIGRAALSVATIVVELAQGNFGSLTNRTALLIGAGKMSTLTARALAHAGLRCVLVANRTYQRAQKLARSLGGQAVHFDALAENLIQADIVICSTGAPHIVLHVEDVQVVLAARPDRPLLIIDLAVPRDVDPAIGELPGVWLADIDDLETQVQAHHPLVVAVRRAAETIVDEELNDFKSWHNARLSVPVIRALRARADAICQAELERTLRRLGDLTPQQQHAIETMGHAIVSKLLHEPILHLKDPPHGISRAQYLDLTQTLFGLN